MSKTIIWSPRAEKDLEEILGYLQSNWEEKVVIQFMDIIDRLINQISLNPNQFPLFHRSRKVRKCILTRHNTIFYRNRRDHIDILRVFDTRKDPEKLKLT